MTPAAAPTSPYPVAFAPEPEAVVLAAETTEAAVFVASATWIPKPVDVSVTVTVALPLVLVTTVVMVELAVVEAWHAVQLVQGADVDHEASVQPGDC